jgi:hypothetical protein
MPNDPKWRTIARASKQPIALVMAVYVHVLVSASTNATERGRTQSLCVEDVASALDVEDTQVQSILDAMQNRVLDGNHVTGWEKRQPIREDGAAERSKAWREGKKAEKERTEQQGERNRTQPNAEKRPDADKEKINTPPIPPAGVDDLLRKPKPILSAVGETRFERFWRVYPKKVGKDAARRAFDRRHVGDDLLTAILAAVTTQAASDQWRKDGGQFVPNPATWINEGRWQDGAAANAGRMEVFV